MCLRGVKRGIDQLLLLLATAAKSLQSCLTLCDPIDGSPPGSPIPGILQAWTLEWAAISFSGIDQLRDLHSVWEWGWVRRSRRPKPGQWSAWHPGLSTVWVLFLQPISAGSSECSVGTWRCPHCQRERNDRWIHSHRNTTSQFQVFLPQSLNLDIRGGHSLGPPYILCLYTQSAERWGPCLGLVVKGGSRETH